MALRHGGMKRNGDHVAQRDATRSMVENDTEVTPSNFRCAY